MKDIVKAIAFVAVFLIPVVPLIVADGGFLSTMFFLFSPDTNWFFPFITGKNFAFRILVEVALAAWIILAFYEPRYRPKFSWLYVALGAFLLIMLAANAQGEYPLKSFWSNFERMDGYVTLVHFGLYVLVVSSLLSNERFKWFGYTTTTWQLYLGMFIVTSLFVIFRSAQQLAGLDASAQQGSWRIYGTLGNASYMAIYMLFMSFVAFLLTIRSQVTGWRVFYLGMVLIYVTLLIFTVTRGTTIGLVAGGLLAALYIAIFERRTPALRKGAIVFLVLVTLCVGLFVAVKDTSLVQENRLAQRLANVSVSSLDTRITIWKMAGEGFQERPLLGWGQGNFNYVFNEYYNPSLHSVETWYDRAHNLVFDWLIAGGILGLVSYFAILFAALYYLFWQPLFKREDEQVFSVAERAVLLGLLAAYFIHNLVVFDNIVSYIFYAVILAFIHTRVASTIPKIQTPVIQKEVVNAVVVPTVAVLLILTVYLVNIPGINSARDIIVAFQATSAEEMISSFDKALENGSFADQEIREQLTQRVQAVVRNPQVSDEVKNMLAAKVQTELIKQVEEKPGDARLHVFFGSFYRSVGQIDLAREQMQIARDLSPLKQAIILEQGFVEFQASDFEAANAYFEEAFNLATEYSLARAYYMASLARLGRVAEAEALVLEADMNRIAGNQFLRREATQAEAYRILIAMDTYWTTWRPKETTHWINLATSYARLGQTDQAVDTLRLAAEANPSFKESADRFIANVEAGRGVSGTE